MWESAEYLRVKTLSAAVTGVALLVSVARRQALYACPLKDGTAQPSSVQRVAA
jgi:hypothetical protein